MMFKKTKPKRRTQWTEEEKEKLRNLFEEFEGDVVRISIGLNDSLVLIKRCLVILLFLAGLIIFLTEWL